MISILLSVLPLLSQPLSSTASPLQKRIDNTQPSGINPISNFHVDSLGDQTSANSCVNRDLGFTGALGGTYYAVYGDTSWCASGVSDPSKNNFAVFSGMVRDTIAQVGNDPLHPTDFNLNSGDRPQQFIPFNASWSETQDFGFGGTSPCATDDSKSQGVVYYVINANNAGLRGVGVALVEVQNGAPTVIQRSTSDSTPGYWWSANTTARYGDVVAYRDQNSEYIYALGGAPNSAQGFTDQQDGGHVERRTGPDSLESRIQFKSEPATANIALRTAPSPEGPWTDDKVIYTVPNPAQMVYAGVAYPYLDESGKTLTIAVTNYPRAIEIYKVTFG
ncbi:MAG: hypothetical protein Q9227_008325 [Pyrenula ochraceoflavens]